MHYNAVIWLEDNDTYSVMFPDLPGCYSMGDTLNEARIHAREALNLYLEETPTKAFARPSKAINPDDYSELASRDTEVFPVEVDKNIAFALKLRWQREDHGLTQPAMADRLGVRLSAYQRLENPGKSNATLKTIQRLEEVISGELVLV